MYSSTRSLGPIMFLTSDGTRTTTPPSPSGAHAISFFHFLSNSLHPGFPLATGVPPFGVPHEGFLDPVHYEGEIPEPRPSSRSRGPRSSRQRRPWRGLPLASPRLSQDRSR